MLPWVVKLKGWGFSISMLSTFTSRLPIISACFLRKGKSFPGQISFVVKRKDERRSDFWDP